MIRMRDIGPVTWVVNDIGELGVRVDGQFYWLYKGESLQYENGKHDDGTPMLWRRVGKREFGEVCHPPSYKGGRYTQTLSKTNGFEPDNPEYEWQPLPSPRSARRYVCLSCVSPEGYGLLHLETFEATEKHLSAFPNHVIVQGIQSYGGDDQ